MPIHFPPIPGDDYTYFGEFVKTGTGLAWTIFRKPRVLHYSDDRANLPWYTEEPGIPPEPLDFPALMGVLFSGAVPLGYVMGAIHVWKINHPEEAQALPPENSP